MTNGPPSTTKRQRAAWAAGIVLLAAGAGMAVDWSVPGLARYEHDRLMRARGRLPAPDDIAIVAIDQTSIDRLGHFPWRRSVMARAIDAVATAQPKVIALDVLYTDPSTPDEDAALAKAVEHAGNVVVAAELVDSPVAGGPAKWLLPLPELQSAAAAIGHVNVLAESEGVGRSLLITAADDSGRTFRAMAVEVVRIADRTPEQGVTDSRDAVLVGQRVIPIETEPPSAVIGQANAASVQYLRAARMNIDYIGPTGSFARSTYSIADVLEGRTPPSRFRGKYVLIGATAPALGDRLASPYIHSEDRRGDQHGALMPGVEVLANSMNTILRSRFYSATPGWLAFLIAAAVAALTVILLGAAQGRHEFLKQVAVLVGMTVAIIVCSYLFFTRFFVYPPLTPALVSFASAGLLGLVRRSMVTNMRLDENIATLARTDGEFAPHSDPSAAAESIARFANATAVAIYQRTGFEFNRAPEYRLLAAHGGRAAKRVHTEKQFVEQAFSFPPGDRDRYQISHVAVDDGALVIVHPPARGPSLEEQRLYAAVATACIESSARRPGDSWRIPNWLHGAGEKARTLGRLNRRLMERTRFVDLALGSVDDGLVISSADGRIAFANVRAAEILRSLPDVLVGTSLLERLSQIEERGQTATAQNSEREILQKLLVDRAQIEREITVRASRPRRYVVRMTAVTAQKDNTGPVLGVVASFSDITRHYELQQTKNDVVALVSHEMRTPLTAIQGMSELLASYDMDLARRKEMSGAINNEAKRLTRMITDYLDIARLESGATVLRLAPLRLDPLLDRTLLLLEPLASARGITLTRRQGELEPFIADPDLLGRAVSNLVSNAIKYSPTGTEVIIATGQDEAGAFITVQDHGYGIAPEHLKRIFEKFYRVPRVENADAPGTGLGLALVREIAELHGGTVRVSSEPGAGSTFTLSIPIKKAES